MSLSLCPPRERILLSVGTAQDPLWVWEVQTLPKGYPLAQMGKPGSLTPQGSGVRGLTSAM